MIAGIISIILITLSLALINDISLVFVFVVSFFYILIYSLALKKEDKNKKFVVRVDNKNMKKDFFLSLLLALRFFWCLRPSIFCRRLKLKKKMNVLFYILERERERERDRQRK